MLYARCLETPEAAIHYQGVLLAVWVPECKWPTAGSVIKWEKSAVEIQSMLFLFLRNKTLSSLTQHPETPSSAQCRSCPWERMVSRRGNVVHGAVLGRSSRRGRDVVLGVSSREGVVCSAWFVG